MRDRQLDNPCHNRGMIYAKSDPARYRTLFSDGKHDGIADTIAEHGGEHAGFRPHDLLEAALAACVNMTVRMYADHHNIPLQDVTTKVTLDRTHPEKVTFRYEVELDGDLSPEQREKLAQAARACPVRKTLSKQIEFKCGDDLAGAAPR